MAVARRVAAYRAVRGEVPLDELLDGERREVFTLPRVVGDDLEFVAWHAGQTFAPGAFGIPEPVGGELVAFADHDVVLVPLTAFDGRCHRVGQGGGFYDRALGSLPARTGRSRPAAIGVAYAFQQVDEVPRDSWDVPLDAVVTETGLVIAEAARWPDRARRRPEALENRRACHRRGGGRGRYLRRSPPQPRAPQRVGGRHRRAPPPPGRSRPRRAHGGGQRHPSQRALRCRDRQLRFGGIGNQQGRGEPGGVSHRQAARRGQDHRAYRVRGAAEQSLVGVAASVPGRPHHRSRPPDGGADPQPARLPGGIGDPGNGPR